MLSILWIIVLSTVFLVAVVIYRFHIWEAFDRVTVFLNRTDTHDLGEEIYPAQRRGDFKIRLFKLQRLDGSVTYTAVYDHPRILVNPISVTVSRSELLEKRAWDWARLGLEKHLLPDEIEPSIPTTV